ncbi:hypothetical protein L2E82_49792 [Cichorium intybus]|uniref:Uncharacterized protein n=1 Tax=Cichorium intybus TaxID=13427 RepID=A0ACB8Z1H1_CICIN|nr:hypothetical protein L2E82_49792 [Cichorium intybus]
MTLQSGIEKLNQEIELTSKLSILSDILSNTCCALLIHSHTISFDPHLGNFDLVPKMKEITRLGKMKERTRAYSFRLDSRVVSERGVEKRLVNGDGGAADLFVGEVRRETIDRELGIAWSGRVDCVLTESRNHKFEDSISSEGITYLNPTIDANLLHFMGIIGRLEMDWSKLTGLRTECLGLHIFWQITESLRREGGKSIEVEVAVEPQLLPFENRLQPPP